MSSHGHSNPFQLHHRSPVVRPAPIPNLRIDSILQPAAIKRAASSTASSTAAASHTCGPHDTTGICQRYVAASTETLPIVLGVVIPLVGAFVVLLYLHRRHVKKLRKEDADDAHKSLDFGTGGIPYHLQKKGRGKGKNGVPEMSFSEAKASIRKERGMSMDLDMSNPYLLPPGLQQSRESLHSLSRTLNDNDDKYQRTTFIPDDGSISYPASIRSPHDDSSSFTASSRRRFEGDPNQDLLRIPQTISRNSPQSRDHSTSSNSRKPLPPAKNSMYVPATVNIARDFGMKAEKMPTSEVKEVVTNVQHEETPPKLPEKELPPKVPEKATLKDNSSKRKSVPKQSYFAALGPEAAQPTKEVSDKSTNQREQLSADRQPHAPSVTFPGAAELNMNNQHSKQAQYNQHSLEPPSHQSEPPRNQHFQLADYLADDDQDYYDYVDYADELGYDPHRLEMMGERPLPPDDPTESKEQRANRIRSFYKEYFDETNTSRPQMPSRHNHYDGSETYDGYDVVGYYEDNNYQPPPRHAASHRTSYSMGSFQPGPRAYSSASGRYGPQGRRGPPKQRLPPPKALNLLPTPHLLKDDLYLPMDFAPPSSVRGQRSGTPDSLRGGQRAYTRVNRAHVPLTSAFDDLAVMPSPHALRKSSTFTALDFAPPPRIKGDGSGSDNGSIRSGRSNMSAAQLHSIRTGAYRVSRIPKEVAGTKDELANSLRPNWDMAR